MTTPTTLGHIFLPGGQGTGVGTFEFIVDRGAGDPVQIGTPVSADTAEGTLIGVVVDMRTVGFYRDALAAAAGDQVNPTAAWAGRERDERPELTDVVVAQVQVFHSPTLRPPRAGTVRPATREELATACGADRIDWHVPAGVVELLDGTFARVDLDGHNLLGREGAHANIGGISGQAAKSSYAGVLLASAIAAGERTRDDKGRVTESVCALVFNLKGTDLLFLDREPQAGYELTSDDEKIYDALGVPAKPFEHVQVYAPAMPAGAPGVRSARKDALRLQWGLADIFPYVRHVAPDLYGNDNSRLFLEEFRDMLLYHPNEYRRVDTFAKLETWFDEIEEEVLDDHGTPTGETRLRWRSHHPATLLKMKKRLLGLKSLFGGLVADGKAAAADDIPTSGWSHGQVIVVDISAFAANAKVQALIVARTIERIYEAKHAGELGCEHAVIWADELNGFAPKDGGGDLSTVKKALQIISTQGRSAGVSLWGMAQMLSKVDELVRDNAATRVLGVTSDAELASGIYGRLSRGITEQIATLPRGQVCVWHYTLRAPLVVRFPRPAWQTGQLRDADGGAAVRTPKSTDALGLSKASVEALTRGVPDEARDRILADAPDAETAKKQLERARKNDARESHLHERVAIRENPFALDDDD